MSDEKKYFFTMVPADRVMQHWRVVAPILEPAVDRSHGRWTMDHLLAAICLGHHALWVTYTESGEIKGAMTTQVIDYPATRIVAIQFLGGTDFEKWVDGICDLAEKYAADVGASGLETAGRFGFWKYFKKRGYARSWIMYECATQRKQL
jgi:hypothetical protein